MQPEVKRILMLGLALLLLVAAASGIYFFLHSTALVGKNGMGVHVTPGIMGTLKAQTGTSVTILLQDGLEKTFAVSKYTQIITRVSSGEVGKTLEQMESGATLLIMSDTADPSSAASISLLPALSVPAPSPEGPLVSIVGKVAHMTSGTIVVETEDQGIVSVIASESTPLYSNALAGQRGKTYADIALGVQIVVSGITAPSGVKANSIQLLVLLGR